MTSDQITTPYDYPQTLLDRLLMPSLAQAYRQGAEDAGEMGLYAFQLGIDNPQHLLKIVRQAQGNSWRLRRKVQELQDILDQEEA